MTKLRRHGRTLLAAGSLLLLGAALGITADRTLHHRRAGVQVIRLDRERVDPVDLLDRTLGLRPDQRERVAAIFQAHQPEMNRIWGSTHRRLVAILDTVVADVTAVLDAEQAARFRSLVEQLHATPHRPPEH